MITTFTVGEASDLLDVSCRTVSKWCDAGRLDHYRLPSSNRPGAGDRRITRDAIIAFLRKHNMPSIEDHERRQAERRQHAYKQELFNEQQRQKGQVAE